MADFKYIFDCPVYGETTTGYCFRAFDRENISRWKKLKVVYAVMEFDKNELEGYLSFLTTLCALKDTVE